MIQRPGLESQVLKRSLAIDGHKTSISLEAAFWGALKEIAARERISVPALVTRIDTERQHPNLSSVVRLYVVDHYRRQALAAGGNGNRS
jgi:predicted DNA-binding ribbon-helix-helix protein